MPPGELIQGAWHTTDDELLEDDTDDELDVAEELDDIELELDTDDIDELDDVFEDVADELAEDVELDTLELDDDDIDEPGALAIDDDAPDVATFLPPVHAASTKVTKTENVRCAMCISLIPLN